MTYRQGITVSKLWWWQVCDGSHPIPFSPLPPISPFPSPPRPLLNLVPVPVYNPRKILEFDNTCRWTVAHFESNNKFYGILGFLPINFTSFFTGFPKIISKSGGGSHMKRGMKPPSHTTKLRLCVLRCGSSTSTLGDQWKGQGGLHRGASHWKNSVCHACTNMQFLT